MRKIAVVVVHGIGLGTGEDRCEFSRPLKEKVKMMLPDGVDFVWEEANWEKLNDDIDVVIERVLNGLCDRYICEAKGSVKQQESNAKMAPCKTSKWRIIRWVAYAYSCIRVRGSKAMLRLLELVKKHLPGIIDAAIDLPLYMQEPKGDEIRGVVREKIECVMKGADVDKVVLVGHSLGSVIAFDVAVDELAKNGGKRLAALVTMGSPLNWVEELRKAASNGKKALSSMKALLWLNFWDPADPVPEHRELDDAVFPGVRNVKVESGRGISAHCAYWNDEQIARKISSMLKGDFSLDPEGK